MRLLIVDDDVELCSLLKEFLEREGYSVQCVHEGHAALDLAQQPGFDLIVLDVMLPGLDGFEILKRLRLTSRVPVLMLTARGEDVDRIVGLELGADDYLPKPYNPRELAARIHAVLRRTSGVVAKDLLTPATILLDDIRLDMRARAARHKTREIELTSAEFELLALFFKSPGQVLSR